MNEFGFTRAKFTTICGTTLLTVWRTGDACYVLADPPQRHKTFGHLLPALAKMAAPKYPGLDNPAQMCAAVSFVRQDIRLWRDPALGAAGTELACGRGVRHSFGPLIRDEVTIAAVTSGVLRHRVGEAQGVATAGHVLLISAGEPFFGEGGAAEGWSWRVFYPDIETLAEMSSDVPAGPPALGPQKGAGSSQQNRVLARRLATLHRAIEVNRGNPQARQQAFAAAIAAALTDGVHPPGWPRRPRPDNKSLGRAIDCVHARFCDPNLAIPDLAAAAGYSQFHFMRSFAAALGVTVHDYVVQCRLHAARALLAEGASAAEVAQAAGFSDQSHMIRQFRSVLGITPGAYVELSRRSTQSRPAAPGMRPGAGR